MEEEKKELLEKMTIEEAKEIANKYANNIWLFGSVDKNCVSRICQLFLEQNATLQKQLDEIKDIASKRLKHNEDYIKTESEDANLIYILSIINNKEDNHE
jgi:hypothetical protein